MKNVIEFKNGDTKVVSNFSFSRIKEAHYWNDRLLNPEFAERKDYEIVDLGEVINTQDIVSFKAA